MKIFRVLVQMPDGQPKRKKGGGGSVQPLRNEESFYAANNIQRVWDEVAELMRGPWAEGELIKIEEAAPAIVILNDADTLRGEGK